MHAIRFITCSAVTYCLFVHPGMSWAINCTALNHIATKDGVFVRSDDAGRVVTGHGRLQFYSAPNYACKMKDIFIVEGQTVNAYFEYAAFTSVVYSSNKSSKPVIGWVRSDRLKRNALGIAPIKR
jgi:hypothetical protein